MGNQLKAGTAATNITPALGSPIPGHLRPRYAEDVDDHLFAKALVLECGGRRLATVTCDLIEVPRPMVAAVKARLAERCGLAPEELMVNGTHTHTGAGVDDLAKTPGDPSYIEWVPTRIADAVELALRRLQPARIGFGLTEEHGISFYRRWRMKDGTVRMNPPIGSADLVEPAGAIDPDVVMMYVEGMDGIPLAGIVNFALHYVGTDNHNAISADYFGHFDRSLKEALGPQVVGIIWNACSGQINNIDWSGEKKREAKGHEQGRRVAKVLVDHLLEAIPKMELSDEIPLSGAMESFKFHRKAITEKDLQIADEILSGVDGALDYEEGPFSWVVGQPIPKDLVDVYAEQCKLLATLPEQMEAEVQALRIGAAGIVTFPGEVFVEIGRRVKELLAGAQLFTPSLANGYIGYICTDKALMEEGGYETWAATSSLGAVGTEPAMIAAAQRAWQRASSNS